MSNAVATVKVQDLSIDELSEILKRKKHEHNELMMNKRAAYEGIRADLVYKIERAVRRVTEDVHELYNFVCSETLAFREIMGEYGALKRDNQLSFQLEEGNFRIEVKTNKVKKFDERADLAATRLIEFLTQWISDSNTGQSDPMYQLAMTLLERNKYGDLDYKSISKLYELEEDFASDEYRAIMVLFRESNVVEGTATNFYFWERNNMGVWKRVEPSFNRL